MNQKPHKTGTRTSANSEATAEMPHKAAFHQGLHYLREQKRSSEKEIQMFGVIITCVPSIDIINDPGLSVSIFMENSIGLQFNG